jgi:YfiH family protein
VDLIAADWPAPPGVKAVATTRRGGVSLPPYDSLNLGANTDDDPSGVAANRQRLCERAGLPEAPRWLRQVHGTRVVAARDVIPDNTEADAQWTAEVGVVLAVLTADCLPVVLCDDAGGEIAVAHAGWRGLSAGILEATAATFARPPERLMAWLGPAIGPQRYEVGDAVRDAFLAADPAAEAAFRPARPGHWWADLYQLARQRLAAAGVAAVYGGGLCTAGEPERFFSHRRDGPTGRLGTLIWREG